ncbi:MAG: DUF1624 domain-containing protein [Bacteroidia bacterium]|nr:DUF1624 domain-containing protein [Bacteroidia bacterium]
MVKSGRLVFLDVFRGITIAAMILVNNPGSWNHVYRPLLHADWHGCTPTDLIFPFFIFIVGVSIAIAIGKRKAQLDNHGPIIQKIIRRTLLIFLIGILLNLIPSFNFSTLRIPGVLQRIAVIYGITAFLFLKFNKRQLTYFGIGALFVYWILMTWIPVPDGFPPNLDPETNIGAWLDRTLLNGHLWSQSEVWDPEGILSTLPALGTSIIGILTGIWIKQSNNINKRLNGLFAVGTLLIFAGLVWGMFFPINKNIWTSSYVLYTGGIGITCLAFIHWVMDIKFISKWATPFKIMGMNALFIYILSGVIAKFTHRIPLSFEGESVVLKQWIYLNLKTILDPTNASLMYAIIKVSILCLVAWWMWKKQIFIKV